MLAWVADVPAHHCRRPRSPSFYDSQRRGLSVHTFGWDSHGLAFRSRPSPSSTAVVTAKRGRSDDGASTLLLRLVDINGYPRARFPKWLPGTRECRLAWHHDAGFRTHAAVVETRAVLDGLTDTSEDPLDTADDEGNEDSPSACPQTNLQRGASACTRPNSPAICTISTTLGRDTVATHRSSEGFRLASRVTIRCNPRHRGSASA